MNRTIVLLLLFAVLGLGSMLYLKSDKGKTGLSSEVPTGSFEKQFSIEDTDVIGKIFIADRDGNRTTLKRNGDHWTYNDKYVARQTAVDNLLSALRMVRVKYRPAKSAEKIMVDNLSSVGTKVEVYDKKGEKIKCFYVGGSTHDAAGTFMILENAQQPLVAHIPTWVGNLQVRFGLIGDDWRDRNVFGEKPEEIQSVTLEYPDPNYINYSFNLERTGRNNFSVKPFYATSPVIDKKVVPGKVEAFLVKFERKIVEAIQNEHEDRESVLKQLPFAILTMTNTAGKVKKVKFFPIYPDNTPVQDKDGTFVQTNLKVFRYHIEVNDRDFMLVQQGVFGELFWSYEQFF